MAVIEIDGKRIEVEAGTMIIEAADEARIDIPRFCYHKKLSIAANCRMCLVEVERSPKTLPACATPVVDGMKIYTKSPKALESQKAVMEFLLINHPLDCPICDQGGECELQDVSMGYGQDYSKYDQEKRVVNDENLGSLIATDMTRCIHCTRCVRFGDEIGGIKELGVLNRGERARISTYLEHSIVSEVSGNVIDICPVGALTSKPFRFKARAWELNQTKAIAPHDCIGSHVYVHDRAHEVMRVVPRYEDAINESWLSDRDRFSYLGLNHPDRLLQPMVKDNGKWRETTWQDALQEAAQSLSKVVEKFGPKALGALITPNATTEEMFLFQKLVRMLGSNNIDHRLRHCDFSDQDSLPTLPVLPMDYRKLEESDCVILIGSNIQEEQPIAAIRVRKAIRNDAKVFAFNAYDYPFHFPLAGKWITHPNDWPITLGLLLQTLNGGKALPQSFLNELKKYKASFESLLPILSKAKLPIFVFGASAQNHPQASLLRQITYQLAEACKGHVFELTEGANTAGAWASGCVPHRGPGGHVLPQEGLHTKAMMHSSLKGYLLYGLEPEFDMADSLNAVKALKTAQCVVALTSFKNKYLLEYAQVLLPIAPFSENEGSFFNIEGKKQSFDANVKAKGEARAGWKVLRVLANALNLAGFDYESLNDVIYEFEPLLARKEQTRVPQKQISLAYESVPRALIQWIEWPIYQVDSLVRRSQALQNTPLNPKPCVRINEVTAKKHKLAESHEVTIESGDQHIILKVKFDDRVPDDVVWIGGGYEEVGLLLATGTPIHLKVGHLKDVGL